MDVVEEFLDKIQIKDKHAISELKRISEVRRFKKGDIIMTEGEVPEFFPFLLSGIARGYSTDLRGKEYTNCLASHRMDSLSGSMSINAKAMTNVEALTDVEALCFPTEEIYNLVTGSKPLMLGYIGLLQISLSYHFELKCILCAYTAMERYKWFLRTYPGLDQEISDKYIASYLNMTPVSLSRQRSALRKEQSE